MSLSSLTDFEIGKTLGKGSFGMVCLVKRKFDGKTYAMKRIKIVQLSEKDKENALNEIRILASLSHKNIIGYKDAFFDQKSKTLNIVMEFADDGDIATKIKYNLKHNLHFEENTIWKYLIQILEGLNYLHEKKIIHRDLKSANIFLMKDTTIKIGDLNVSKYNKLGMAYTQTGTPYYASPEIWLDQPYDYKSDIWSLGCILYEICQLKPPFRGTSLKNLCINIQKGLYNPIPDYYSDDMKKIIGMMLKRDPNLRPSTKQILDCEIIKRKRNELKIRTKYGSLEEKQGLIATIKIPRNLGEINKNLPMNKYNNKQIREEMMMEDEYETTKRKNGFLNENDKEEIKNIFGNNNNNYYNINNNYDININYRNNSHEENNNNNIQYKYNNNNYYDILIQKNNNISYNNNYNNAISYGKKNDIYINVPSNNDINSMNIYNNISENNNILYNQNIPFNYNINSQNIMAQNNNKIPIINNNFINNSNNNYNINHNYINNNDFSFENKKRNLKNQKKIINKNNSACKKIKNNLNIRINKGNQIKVQSNISKNRNQIIHRQNTRISTANSNRNNYKNKSSNKKPNNNEKENYNKNQINKRQNNNMIVNPKKKRAMSSCDRRIISSKNNININIKKENFRNEKININNNNNNKGYAQIHNNHYKSNIEINQVNKNKKINNNDKNNDAKRKLINNKYNFKYNRACTPNPQHIKYEPNVKRYKNNIEIKKRNNKNVIIEKYNYAPRKKQENDINANLNQKRYNYNSVKMKKNDDMMNMNYNNKKSNNKNSNVYNYRKYVKNASSHL